MTVCNVHYFSLPPSPPPPFLPVLPTAPLLPLDRFLELLGRRVRLKGWTRYRGGLDVGKDQTGLWSVYTEFEEHEIMFHVSTLLPYDEDDRQQVNAHIL